MICQVENRSFKGVISGNTICQAHSHGIDIVGENATVADNHIYNLEYGGGISAGFSGTTGTEVARNVILGGNLGIYTDGSYPLAITNELTCLVTDHTVKADTPCSGCQVPRCPTWLRCVKENQAGVIVATFGTGSCPMALDPSSCQCESAGLHCPAATQSDIAQNLTVACRLNEPPDNWLLRMQKTYGYANNVSLTNVQKDDDYLGFISWLRVHHNVVRVSGFGMSFWRTSWSWIYDNHIEFEAPFSANLRASVAQSASFWTGTVGIGASLGNIFQVWFYANHVLGFPGEGIFVSGNPPPQDPAGSLLGVAESGVGVNHVLRDAGGAESWPVLGNTVRYLPPAPGPPYSTTPVGIRAAQGAFAIRGNRFENYDSPTPCDYTGSSTAGCPCDYTGSSTAGWRSENVPATCN